MAGFKAAWQPTSDQHTVGFASRTGGAGDKQEEEGGGGGGRFVQRESEISLSLSLSLFLGACGFEYPAYGTARGSSDKNFRLCPSTDGRPYLLGFEKFLSGVTGRGWKEARDGLVASLRLRSHVSGEVQKSMTSTKQKTMPSTNIYMFITIGPMKKL